MYRDITEKTRKDMITIREYQKVAAKASIILFILFCGLILLDIMSILSLDKGDRLMNMLFIAIAYFVGIFIGVCRCLDVLESCN